MRMKAYIFTALRFLFALKLPTGFSGGSNG